PAIAQLTHIDAEQAVRDTRAQPNTDGTSSLGQTNRPPRGFRSADSYVTRGRPHDVDAPIGRDAVPSLYLSCPRTDNMRAQSRRYSDRRVPVHVRIVVPIRHDAKQPPGGTSGAGYARTRRHTSIWSIRGIPLTGARRCPTPSRPRRRRPPRPDHRGWRSSTLGCRVDFLCRILPCRSWP